MHRSPRPFTTLPAPALLALALLAGGCGEADSPFAVTTAAAAGTTAATTTTAAGTTTAATGTTAATTTTVTTTTTTTAATTTITTLPSQSCTGPGAGPLPADAEEVSSHTAMLDGDDAADVFRAYLQGETWYLHAALGSGYTTRLALDAAWAAEHSSSEARNVRVDGAFNLGDPGNQVVSVRLYTGLAAAYGLFTLEDCRLVPLLEEDGTLPDLWQGMGPAHSDWPVCGPGRTVLQVVFASPAACTEVSSCPNPNVTIREYRRARDPARLLWRGETSRASTAAEFDEMAVRSCLGA